MTAAARRWLGDSAAALTSLARNRDLLRLELSLLGSVLAHWAYGVAVAVYAYREGGAAAVGVFGIARMLPSAVAAPLTAALADRYRRERVLAAATLVRGAGAAATAFAVVSDVQPAIVYALAAVVQVATTATFPAKAALTPSLARTPVELTAANVVSTTTESAGSFVGPALAGGVLALADVEIALAGTAAAFFVSALLVARIRPTEPAPVDRPAHGLFHELLGGVRAVRETPGVPLLVGLYSAQTLVAGALNVLIVVLALDMLELGEPAVGYLDGVIGVGGVAAMLVVLARAGRGRLGFDFGAGLLLWGVPLVAIGLWPETLVVIPLLAVIGVGNTVVDVTGVTLLQRSAPDAALARVFGVLESLTWLTIGVGALLAPLLVEALGDRGAFVATGALLPLLGLASWRRLMALDASVPPYAERLTAARAVPLFSALSPEVLEQVAAALVPVRFDAGAAIVRQGERGDRFYVMRRGQAAVSVDGRAGEPLGPDDFFGEIALLRTGERTATVTALTDVEAYALERPAFIAAVSGDPAARARAAGVVRARLRSLRPAGASL